MSIPHCQVSIVIKTLNEERNIAAAIESAMAGLQEVGGEVIVADSASTDRTVEIASNYPVTVVQLTNPDERCCGIGPQLGYQYAQGRYVYILDGDMQLRPGFLKVAIAFMEHHPTAGGVAGLVIEHNMESLEYRARVARGANHMKAGQVDRLDMGGLYRREAVEQVGYLSDRNLHSYEELDLATRLRAAGWTLHRIDREAIDHHGHDIPAHRLLTKRWKSRYINGVGEVLAGAWGRAHAPLLRKSLREAKLYSAYAAWLCAGLAATTLQSSLASSAVVLLGTLLLPWIAMALKKRSLTAASYAITSLLFHAGGLVRGLLSRRVPPATRISARLIQQGAPILPAAQMRSPVH